MKKTKFICLFLLVLICLPFLCACDEDVPKATLQLLDTPTDVAVDEDELVVSWHGVENADFYGVEVNGKIHQSHQTQLDISSFVTGSGVYTIRVVAYAFSGSYVTSDFSTAVYLTKKDRFQTPTLQFDDVSYTLFWEPVENAGFYTLVVNGLNYVTTQTSFCLAETLDFEDMILRGEQNTFAVFCSATSDFLNSEVSNQISVNVPHTVIKVVDPVICY